MNLHSHLLCFFLIDLNSYFNFAVLCGLSAYTWCAIAWEPNKTLMLRKHQVIVKHPSQTSSANTCYWKLLYQVKSLLYGQLLGNLLKGPCFWEWDHQYPAHSSFNVSYKLSQPFCSWICYWSSFHDILRSTESLIPYVMQ